MPSRFDQAVQDWCHRLGAEHVVLDPAVLESYSTATYEIGHRAVAVLRPENRDAVRSVLRIAGRFGIPMYPVSGGCNWGLGSRVPSTDRCAILDLSRMSSIVGVDRELGTVTLEPGVTFKDLERFLETHAPEWRMESIGSSGRASIIGNAVERGHGVGVYADRFSNVCSLEVMLADGEEIRTGFGAFEGSSIAGLSRRGLGPCLAGLFCQSSFGIVMALTLWLRPRKASFQSFVFDLEVDRVAGFVDLWRRERLLGSRASLRLFSPARAAGLRKEAVGEREVDPRILDRWMGIGAIEASDDRIVSAERSYLEGILEPWAVDVQFYGKEEVAQIEACGDAHQASWLDFIYHRSLWRGFTSDAPIRMCYAKKPGGAPEDGPLDPDRDHCGVLWFCPSIPATGVDVERLIELVEVACREFEFEVNLGFLSIEERTLEVTGALVYDRQQPQEDQRARQCHDAILDSCREAGYPPYRLGVGSMGRMADMRPENLRLLRRLEKVLDPGGVIAPGRYSAGPPLAPSDEKTALRHLEMICVSSARSLELAARYHQGHCELLDRFGVHDLESRGFWRLLNPNTHLILLLEGRVMIGGIRIDTRHQGFPLPVEGCLASELCPAELERLRALGQTEVAGLWLDDPIRPGVPLVRDGSTLLLGAMIAAAQRLRTGPILGLAHHKSWGALWSYGFEPLMDFGEGGRFPYPDRAYVSTLCRLDPGSFEAIPEPRRSWVQELASGKDVRVLGSEAISVRLKMIEDNDTTSGVGTSKVAPTFREPIPFGSAQAIRR